MKPVHVGHCLDSQDRHRKSHSRHDALARREGVGHGLARHCPRPQKASEHLGIARAYGSYDELLADPEIEAIYNPLPNDGHVPWTLKAARAGKHVLCEKPMAMNARELSALKPLARKVHLAEAFMVRHHPQWIEVRELLRAGEIGRITHMHVAFQYYNDNPKDIRNQLKTGGGALYDIGCYAIVAGRWFFEAEPKRAAGMADRDPASSLIGCFRHCWISARAAYSRSRWPPKAYPPAHPHIRHHGQDGHHHSLQSAAGCTNHLFHEQWLVLVGPRR